MWELKEKNQFGTIERIYKENSFTKKPVYDSISENGIGYNKANLTVEYAVEWLPEHNFDAFDRSLKIGSEVNPWELRNEYITDSLGLAIRMMIIKELDNKSGKPNLYIHIKDPSGNGAEACAEIPSDTIPIIRNMVQENINHKITNLENIVDDLKHEIRLYSNFIKKYNAERLFDDYRNNEA